MSVDRRCAYQLASDNTADGLVVVLYCNYMGKSVLRFYVVNSDLSVVCVIRPEALYSFFCPLAKRADAK